MRPRIPLTEPYDDGPFRVRDALAAGWGEGRLRGRDLVRPFHGLRRAPTADERESSPEESYAPLLREGERFSHVSAARIWGAAIPDEGAAVHVTIAHGARARSLGVVGHVSGVGSTRERHALPVSDPASTFLELATIFGIVDLVVVGDHLVREPRVLDPLDIRPFVPLEDLRAAVAGVTGRGIRAARAAMELVREGSDSPMETRLRLSARAAGLPEPALQQELRDHRGRIGWFDLAWPERRLLLEYDGDQHRTSRAQYEQDMRRLDRAHEAGWRVVRVRAAALLGAPGELHKRLRRAFGLPL